MTATITIPDEVIAWADLSREEPSRATLELFVLEAYRLRNISDGKAAELLGFGTKLQFHELLARRGLFLNYGIEDLEADMAFMARQRTAGFQR